MILIAPLEYPDYQDSDANARNKTQGVSNEYTCAVLDLSTENLMGEMRLVVIEKYEFE